MAGLPTWQLSETRDALSNLRRALPEPELAGMYHRTSHRVVGCNASGQTQFRDRRSRTLDRIQCCAPEPGSYRVRTGLWTFVLTRFLHANRYPLRSKTLQ